MTTIKIKYPERADMETITKIEEEFARALESLDCEVVFENESGILPRPRRPK
jgi:hypothetical protein